MSSNPTIFEEDKPNKTRREGVAFVTRRESVDGGEATPTRREDQGPATTPDTPRRTRRLSLPAALTAQYDYLYDLPATGGEADIALLQDRESDALVIFKYYKAGMAPDPMAMRTLRQANPEYVVCLIDFHDEADGIWELQEYCSLGSLREWSVSLGGKLDKNTLTAVLRETSEALCYLHGLGSGIAHRDLKPANILVRSDQPLDLVLADFGLARTQQAVTHLTTTVKGSWHYAAPEVYAKQSSAKSDWFSLGAIIYELYTGRKLFAMADGTEVSEDDARARCQAHNYSTELVDDPRWRLLADGLLTWDKDLRWDGKKVEAWLAGESPAVYDASASIASTQSTGLRTGYCPDWSPTVVTAPPELAEQLRAHWKEAAGELAGRPNQKMIHFLEGFPQMEEAVRIVKSREAPGSKLVWLQAILDPDGPIAYEGISLDDASLTERIKAGDKGDDAALGWLDSVVNNRILTAYAEATGSQRAAQAAFKLSTWKKQAEDVTKPLPEEYQAIAREAYRTGLPELFAAAFKGE
jgi:serine/threonine protein kinase